MQNWTWYQTRSLSSYPPLKLRLGDILRQKKYLIFQIY